MTQIYNIISIVAFSLAAVLFLLSIIFWFAFNIWDIIGDLTGRNAKKSIEQMRKENESNSVNLYRPSGTYGGSGEISVRQNSTKVDTSDMKTEDEDATTLLSSNAESDDENATELLDDGATELLVDGATELPDEGATELLDEGATELLDESGTELLDDGETESADEDGTNVLQDAESGKLSVISPKWSILQSIVLIHTDEEIA